MATNYNRLVLIGNGYDKALGLKTGYDDFILDYLKEVMIETYRKRKHDSIFMSTNFVHAVPIEFEPIAQRIKKIKTTKDLLVYVNDAIKIKYKYDFFKDIVTNHVDARWVDIEQHYYATLKHEFSISQRQDVINKNTNKIIELNKCMDELSIALNVYIKKQQNSISVDYTNSHMFSLIDGIKDPMRPEYASLITSPEIQGNPKKVMFLNFNYTNTILQILKSPFMDIDNYIHLYIHGTVNEILNPIIFGYGDDTGEDYKKLEITGDNELIRKIKSFQYPRTHNYHKLLNYIESSVFDIYVVGHSCGLSDKTLLKTIFEHPKCLAIKNFHYNGESEDFNKRLEISRHFSNKALMRERVLPFDKLATIPQLPEK